MSTEPERVGDAEGDVAAAQTLYDIVDRAVAAHGDDTVVALHGCFTCQLGAVVYALCVLHLVVEEVVVEVLFQQALNLLLLADTRDGASNTPYLIFVFPKSIASSIFRSLFSIQDFQHSVDYRHKNNVYCYF